MDDIAADAGLERSCEGTPADRLSFAPEVGGIARLDAHLSACTYRPHRHDTYAIGLTLRGVQRYTYRGARRDSLPGEVVVLHPDEVHDGEAGTEFGLRYRMLYLEPAAIMDALAGRARHLPFVPGGHSRDPRLAAALAPALADLDRSLAPLEADEMVGEVADALLALDAGAASRTPRPRALASAAIRRARECLRSEPLADWTAQALEAETGLNRFELARQFRRALGTTPHRYLVMRRLDLARTMARDPSQPLAEIAAATGFADQAHLTRHFRRTYGLTPGLWRSLQADRTDAEVADAQTAGRQGIAGRRSRT